MIDLTDLQNKSIYTFSGSQPGKTVAIFAGVHGNERAGIEAIREMIPFNKISAGTVHFVFANPGAIQKNVRYVEHNLNRLFLRSLKPISREHKRANELMDLLDSCDALLDLHQSNSPRTIPFIICEKNAFSFASHFDFKIVSSGWDAIEPGGSDGYMFQKNTTGITLECGSVHGKRGNVELAKRSIEIFLQLFSITKKEVQLPCFPQKHLRVTFAAKKLTEAFDFARPFNDFDLLPESEVFATDGKLSYLAEKNQYIIFPRKEKKIGEEVFILAHEE